MVNPDATQIATLLAGSVAVTQIIKDLGIQGGAYLKAINIVVAVVLGYVLLYQPDLWSALVLPLLGAIGTGGVSLVDDRLQKMKDPPQG